jgi:hypothetical protein
MAAADNEYSNYTVVIMYNPLTTLFYMDSYVEKGNELKIACGIFFVSNMNI